LGVRKKQKKKYVIKRKTKESSKKSVKEKNSNIKYEIIGLILLATGLLIFLGFYINDSMGIFGTFTRKALTGLLGIPSIIIPILFIIFAIFLIFKKDKIAVKKKCLYSIILTILIAAIFQAGTYQEGDFVNRSPGSCISKFFEDGNKFVGGGVLGGIIALPLLLLFQSLGTIIILSTASIVVTILITNISLSDIARKLFVSIIAQIKAIYQGIKEVKDENALPDDEEYEENINNLGTAKDTRKNVHESPFTEDTAEYDEDVGFTLKISGLQPENAGDSHHEKKVIDMKKHRKFKYFTLGEDKNKIDEENIDSNLKQAEKSNEGEPRSQSQGCENENIDFILNVKSSKSEKTSELSDDIHGKSRKAIENKTKDEIDSHSLQQTIKETLYKYPPLSLLNESNGSEKSLKSYRTAAIEGARKLEETLRSFGVEAKVVNVSIGPTVTRYELQPNTGVKVSRIVSLADDIALNLASAGIRIEAPIPGKAAVGIEVPNKEVTPVLLSEILASPEFNNHLSKVAFAVGKDISGECIVADIAKMPHLLIAGATGSGKSVCINSLIMSILYKASPDEVKMILIDPKVVELGVYNGIPHLLIPVVTDPKKAAGALNWAVQEMVNRYKLFADKGVRDIKSYNEQVTEEDEQSKLPLIVIIIDELADLMMVAPGEVEDAICRLAQMARAAGMHLVIATQRPSVDVITGLIKANIPSRIAFAVSSQVDSRTILDMAGAEKLLGKGDMLFYPTGRQKPLRVQGTFVSDKEIEKTVEFIKSQCNYEYDVTILDEIENSITSRNDNVDQDCDELLEQAIDLVVEAGQASVSLVQRKFKVGYARAARIIDQMEARGIIGGYEGSKPRQVLITKQQWEEMKMSSPFES